MPIPARNFLRSPAALFPFWLVAGFGGMTLLGWWLGQPGLVQPRPGDAVVPANAALCFLLLGAAPPCFARGWTRRGLALAAGAALLAGATLVEGLLHADFGLDHLLADHRAVIDSPRIGRALPGLAASLLLASTLVAWPALAPGASPRRPPWLALGGSLLAAYALTTLFAGRTNLNALPAWQAHAQLALPASLALVTLAAGFFLLAMREDREHGQGARWLWLPVVVGGTTLTLFFWFALRERELAFVNHSTRLTIDNLVSLYGAECRSNLEEFRRLAGRWDRGAETPPPAWERDALAQFNASPAYRSLMWVDAAGRTRWVHPRPGNEDLVGLDHGSVPERATALAEARQGSGLALTAPLASPLRPAFFAAYAPLAAAADGHLVGEFHYDRFVEMSLRRLNLAARYAVRVAVGDPAGGRRAVFESDAGRLDPADRRVQSVDYNLFGQPFTFTLVPRADPGGLGRQLLPELALASGLGVSLLLGLVVNLAQAAHARRRAAERTSAQLQLENEERRRIEARLKLADERLNLALSSTLVGVYEWDVTSGDVFCSASLWQSLGYEPAAMPGTAETWNGLVHPDDRPLFERTIAAHFRGESEFIETEYRVRTAGGDWAWISVRAKCVAFDPAGRPLRVIGTCQNVTARRQAEDALRTSQAAARVLTHVASRTENPVVITSAEGAIEWANESFARVTGYPVAEVRGALLIDLLASPDGDPGALDRATESMLRGDAITTDVAARTRDTGRYYHLRLELQPVRGDHGDIENFIALAADITSRVETENELRRAKAEADAASRAKSEFLASMSHEIRTPMNGVIGMTSLLLETELTAEQRDFVNTIRTSGDALLAIINEILDFSKIESGRMELERQPFELALCIEEALDIFALQASTKGIELAYFVDAAVPPWIEGDMTRVRQVLVNLVNNAVKFTPQGSVTVEVHVSTVETHPGFHVPHVEGGQVLLDFFVTDTGIGIPEERLHLLFKPFSQVDSSTTRKFGGTGLGLAICDRLCQLMGGSIDVKSRPGEGSTFRFSIMAQPHAPVVEEAPSPVPAVYHGRPLLVVDDHAINRACIGRAVSLLGFEPLETHNLYNAAELALQNRIAGAVIDDALEYGEKGAMLAQQLREQMPELPVVLYVSPIDSARRIDRADPWLIRLPKPVKPALLRHVLGELFRHRAGITGGQTVPSFPTSPADTPRIADTLPLDILLVEDNPVNQKVTQHFLERYGYRSDAVGNGLEAVRALQQRRYDLVFMDVQMPEMDGFTATRRIRATLPADRQPRIVALTANVLRGDRERCLEAGMDDYIAKPVRGEALRDVIQRLFAPESPA